MVGSGGGRADRQWRVDDPHHRLVTIDEPAAR